MRKNMSLRPEQVLARLSYVVRLRSGSGVLLARAVAMLAVVAAAQMDGAGQFINGCDTILIIIG